MFVELKQYAERCDLNITISYKLDLMTVIVLPKCKEEQFQLNPIIATGTPEEFDVNFIDSLKSMLDSLVTKIDKLKIDAKGFDESVEAIETEKKPVKKAAAKEEKPKVEKVPSFKELTAQAEEAMKLKDYSKAVGLFAKAVELKPDDKKLKDKLLNAQRWEKSVADMFADHNENDPTNDVPEAIKEIAKESPNIIIAKVSPVEFVEPSKPISEPIIEVGEEFEQPEENDNFGDDEDFSL